MRLKRLLSAFLALVLVVSTIPHAALAEAMADKTYNYVALGDSITSGFGLTSDEGSLADDKALILTEDLINDPVMKAYPMVFGEMVKELGQKRGYTTRSTNLACTAYRAEDVTRTIREAGCKGAVAESILEEFVGEGSSAPLTAYHDIYEKYLPEADLVSIELGGNDIVMAVLVPMLYGENPILRAFALSLALTLFGSSPKTALGAGLQTLYANKDKINRQTISEAAQFFLDVGQNGESYVYGAVDQVEGTLQAVQERNPDAQIALLGMFNPFAADESSAQSLKNTIVSFMDQILGKASDLAAQSQGVDSVEVIGQALTEAVNESAPELCDPSNEEISLDEYDAVVQSSSASLVQLLAAKSVEPQMVLLNELLMELADKYGATYVDVWGIATGNDVDPHPQAEGHRQMAERMYATLYDQVTEAMKLLPDEITLNYNGKKQRLVPAVTTKCGPVYYTLGTSKDEAPEFATSAWSTSVPKAKNAGTYYVWYKVGDESLKCVTVTIVGSDPEPEPKPDPKPEKLSISYTGHVQGIGDLPAVKNGAVLGTIGQSKRLEQFSAKVSGIKGATVSYRAHIQSQGWSDWKSNGKKCGTQGKSRRLEAIQMKLKGTKGWHVWYRTRCQGSGWLGWAKDGEVAGTAGQSKRIEAIQIVVLKDGKTPKSYTAGRASFVGFITGEAYVQSIGWQGMKSVGTIGTIGKGKRIEAIRLKVANQPLSGGIEYNAYLQGKGWTATKANGTIAGSVGESRRLEAVKIRLTGKMATSGKYSVWYRVHSQSYGWLGWAHDGVQAGTRGLSKRAEALEVQILPTGQVPTGYDASKPACVTN